MIPFGFCNFALVVIDNVSGEFFGEVIGGKELLKSAVEILGRSVEGDNVGFPVGKEPIEYLSKRFRTSFAKLIKTTL